MSDSHSPATTASAPSVRWVARLAGGTAAVAIATVLFAAPALAHGGSLSLAAEPVSVPSWLFLVTGGAVVAASFLLTSFVTDRATLEGYHERRLPIPGGERLRRAGATVAGAVGVLGLLAVLVVGFVGPVEPPRRNLAVLLVWVLWWAGLTMSVYLLGNAWPALDPFRTLSRLVPGDDGLVSLPDGVGSWPSVAGLLLLVWLEVVSDVAGDPTQLATLVAAYALVTVGGVVAVGREAWFGQVDPVAHVFRVYGRVAPVQRTDDSLELVVPGAALAAQRVDPRGRRPTTERSPEAPADGGTVESDVGTVEASGPGSDAVGGRTAAAGVSGEVGFVVALLWVTSFDGFVATPTWARLVAPVVEAGVPAELAYFGALLAGYWLFLGVYWGASKLARRTGKTFLSTATVAAAFAPALVPIAAGYHFAHYAPYFMRLSPTLAVVAAAPLSPPFSPPTLGLPGWFGYLGPTAVLVGHVLGVWVAHSRAFDLFVGKLQPIRSQYPYVAVMVLYTMSSLWLLAQPYGEVPFV